jgi:hypothetical protein
MSLRESSDLGQRIRKGRRPATNTDLVERGLEAPEKVGVVDKREGAVDVEALGAVECILRSGERW